MVFGLFFIGVALIGLILMYNHGVLTRDRVQVENAADAAAYSQAKLFARHQNLIAYTNRAIVANEMSVGQVVALMSWSKRYANIPRWVNTFPVYQIPIAPPSPKPTISDVLSTITLPYQILGNVTGTVAKPLLGIYPDVISSFNLVMGFFQKIFAVATLEAQFTAPLEIVDRHEMPGTNDDLKVVTLSHLLLAQNFILTYFASDLNLNSLVSQAKGASAAAGGGATSAEDFVADFLGSLTPSTMLVNTAPEQYDSSNAQNADNSAARTAGRQYAAIMNSNRNDWLDARNFDASVSFGVPEIPIYLGVINIKLGFNLEVGVFNNGGTAYVYNPQSTAAGGKGIPRYGWTSVDFSSLGFKLDVSLEIEACLPLVGCITILDTDFGFDLGLPLGGGTHQIVAKAGDQFLVGSQWGSPTQNTPPGSPRPYGETMQTVHAATWIWGNTLGAFGANQAEDVSTGYGGAPSFFSLGRDYQGRGTSNEFTVAVAKPLGSLRTSDNPASLGLDTGKFALDTQGVHDNALSSLWGGPDNMMTIASAESYFAPPPGRIETPNQFSPFWDARLREPSRVVQMIAAGQIDLMAVLGLQAGASTSAIVGAVLDLGLKKLIEPGKDRLIAKLPSVISGPVKPVLDKFVDTVTTSASGAVSGLVK
ncbi:MAG: hypothetical protein K2X80_02485 [Pseudomonadaceae bacterium]|nr:hypothetical protein [Pseudomonadaceae bacterium]